MKVKCNIDTHHSVKNGLKITLYLDKQQKKEAMKHLHEFEDMPLEVEFLIDAVKRKEMLAMINEDQRKKIYAIFRDIGNHFGYSDEDAKLTMKPVFLKAYPQHTDFSLSNCSKELASDFIEFLVLFCFKYGVPLKDHPREAFSDLDKYLWLCLKEKKCVVCLKPAEQHHIDSIGMGRDRTHYDDSQHRKMALCSEHHRTAPDSIHNLGVDSFCEKYHVHGIIFKEG